jgi:GNAT superfamily N-acetyltransferase
MNEKLTLSEVIREFTTKEDWLQAFPVLHELRPHLNEATYLDLLMEMRKEGYKMFALLEKGEVVAVTGVIILTNLYYGRHVYVNDLVTHSSARSKGFGEKLITYVEQWGRENDCKNIALSSGMQRTDAHRFYQEKMAYERPSFVFKKLLED